MCTGSYTDFWKAQQELYSYKIRNGRIEASPKIKKLKDQTPYPNYTTLRSAIMSATQLSFTLRTSVNVKTAHLLGSWDNYSGQLPLSRDTSKSGGWKGTFRFSSSLLKPGQRYWYYVSLCPPCSLSKKKTNQKFFGLTLYLLGRLVYYGWLPCFS